MLTTLRAWLRSTPRPAARPRARLGLLHLEDRSVPAAFDPTFGAGGAFQLGDPGRATARNIAADTAGNVYVIGGFIGTTDFDPGPGTVALTSQGDRADTFVAKYTAAGGLVWVRSYDGDGFIVTADESGNVYVGGGITGTVDLDPGTAYPDGRDVVVGRTESPSTGYVARFNADGSFAWVRYQTGPAAWEYTNSVEVAGGAVYTANYIPGSGTAVVKFTADGSQLWEKRMTGTGAFRAQSLAVDGAGSVHFVAALSVGQVDADPGPGTARFSSTAESAVVQKLNSQGEFVWARQLLGQGYVTGTDIAVDAAGTVYTCGYFEKTADFDPGKGKYSLTGGGMFLSKLTSAGNFASAQRFAVDIWLGPSIALDASGGVYLAGSFVGTGDFDPGAGVHAMTSAGATDTFILKLDAGGNLAWAVWAGGAGNHNLTGLVVNGAGDVYVAGSYWQPTTFGDLTLDNDGTANMFIAKVTQA